MRPSRSKILCLETSIKIYRSPEIPPLGPVSPSPARRIRVPVSTPGGTFTLRALSFFCVPCPPQEEHGFLIICPAPEQVGQPLSTVKKPWVARTLPNPEHVGHVVGEDPPAAPVPLQDPHATEEGTFIVFAVRQKRPQGEIDKL